LADSSQALFVALEAARSAAAVHQKHLGTVSAEQWSEKGVADFVTHVDREAEANIVDVIQSRFPTHDILAEEAAAAGALQRTSEWLWIVDPLDGTTNYLHGYPMYCASVALLHDGDPFAGAVVCAATGEAWTARKGGGAFRNGQRIHVSETDRFQRALVGTGFPFKLPEIISTYIKQFEQIMRRASDIRRAGSAALDLCHLASGYFDAFWELDLRPWDYAAGALMIREAGGVVRGLHDAGTRVGDLDWLAGSGVIAGNTRIYSELLEVLGLRENHD
jgi:myo-inositol-1(or 4)-monophosphatase